VRQGSERQGPEVRVSLSADEVLLLQSALSEPTAAVESWTRFCQSNDLTQLQGSLARVLPLVARNVLRPSEPVPGEQLLRGVRRATWVQNTTKMQTYRQLRELIHGSDQFVLLKGAATMHLGMDAASRAMSDIDVFVPNARLRDVLMQMETLGFTPRGLGNTRDVLERHRHRAIGCNLTHPRWGEVDIHWGLATNIPLSRLSLRRQERIVMRSSHVEPATGMRYCSKELLLVHTLQHMVRQDPNSRLALIQGLCDIATIQKGVHTEQLDLLLDEFELSEAFKQVESFLEHIAGDAYQELETVSFDLAAGSSPFVPEIGKWLDEVEPRERIDPALERYRLRWHRVYILWQLLGSNDRLERVLRRVLGVFTRTRGKVCASAEFSFESGCSCDNHVGVGWTPWIPTSSGVWSDRRDSRVLLRVPHYDPLQMRLELVLQLGQEWVHAPYETVEIVANGMRLGSVQRVERETGAGSVRRFTLNSSFRGESILEVSFRPMGFVPRRLLGLGSETHRLGIALHTVRVEVIAAT